MSRSADRDPVQLVEKNRGAFTKTAHRLFRSLYWCILLSASVWIASIPLVASEFHRFVPVAVLTNLLIAALLPVVMAVGFACLLTTALPVEWCTWLGVLAGYLFDTLKWVAAGVANLPASALRVHALPTWWIVMWYVALAMLLLHLCNRSKMLKNMCKTSRACTGPGSIFISTEDVHIQDLLFAFSVVGWAYN